MQEVLSIDDRQSLEGLGLLRVDLDREPFWQPPAALTSLGLTEDESWRLLCHNLLPVPYGTRIRVRIGDPMPRGGEGDVAGLLDRAWQEIEGTLVRWRSGSGSC